MVLEDTVARTPRTLAKAELLRRIWGGVYAVVMSGTGATIQQQESNGRASELRPIDLSSIPDSWTKEVEFRMTFIQAVRAGHVSRGDRRRVGKIVGDAAMRLGLKKAPSASAVMEWLRRLDTSEGNPLALVSLRKTRQAPRRKSPLVDEVIAKTLRDQYFTKARHSLRHAHDVVRRELEIHVHNGALTREQATVGYTTVFRRAQEVDLYQRIAKREGDARARMVCRTAIVGGAAEYPLQRAEVDHTALDWVVICDRTGLPLGRPVLTIVMDAFSGYLLGLYLSFYGPGVTSVCGVLRSAVKVKDDEIAHLKLTRRWLAYGLADEWVLDNGLEFHSKAFKNMSWLLGIDMTYCKVRTPWLKPHVERFFADLGGLTLARGRVEKRKPNMVVTDPYADACIGFSDLVEGLIKFAVEVHPFQINARKLARPYDLFEEGLSRCPPAVFPGSMEELKLISGLSKTLTLGQGGIELMGLPYGGAELAEMRKRHGRVKVCCKWDPDDIATMFVQDPKDKMHWAQAHCLWSSYAAELSWQQHLTIRDWKRKNLTLSGSEDALWRARLSLHDHWQSAVKRRRPDALLAARYAGFTSAKVLAGADPVPKIAPETPVSAKTIVEQEAVPDFETFDLEAS